MALGIGINPKLLVTFFIIFTPIWLFAQTAGYDTSNPDLSGPPTRVANAHKIETPPNLDGDVLDDPVWISAEPVTGFWQTNPSEGEPASERTEVRIIYTSRTLYVGVVCYDRNPNGIIVSESRRDVSLNETDAFQILLDTYNDDQNGFIFGTTPAGIEYDAQVTNEGAGSGRPGAGSTGFNLNWDGSWEVHTQTSNIGWSAEFAIPFRTLRFKAGDSQTWGLNFQRNIRRRNENSFWVKLSRQYDIKKVSLAGTLTGLHGLRQNNLKVMPYSLGEVNRDFIDEQEAKWDGDFGLDVKYSVTSSLTLDATYNTDFAQVEVDEQQINLNRFNLFFPEKRPFFLENAGFFNVGSSGDVELFFSRRIGIAQGREVPILGGLRLSGKVAGLNVGLLNMQTESAKFISPSDPDTTLIQANNFTVTRLNKELPNRSAIGAIFINRQGTGDLAPDDDYNRTLALDARWGIGKYGRISGYAARTFSPDLKGDEYAFNLSAGYDSEAWLLLAGYREVGNNFNPEVGFLRRSGYRNPSALIFHRYRPRNFMGLLELRPHISYRGFWNFAGFQETGFLHMDNHWEWRNGYEVHTIVNVTREGISAGDDSVTIQGVFIPPETYDHAEFQLVANTNQGAWWSFRTRVTIGGYFGGDRIAVSPSVRFRMGDTFNARFSLNHTNADLPQGSFVTNLFRARFSYSFTPRIFLQALIQYNNSDDIWSTNLRFGWLQTANTGLFVVFRDTRFEESGSFNTQFRSFVVKYSYLLDLLN